MDDCVPDGIRPDLIFSPIVLMLESFLPHVVEKAIFRLCEDLASPRSLAVSILLENKEWDQLSMLEIDPNHYRDPLSYWRDAMATSILRKCEDLPTSFDREATAEEVFLTCERQCLRANRRFYSLATSSYDESIPRGVSDILIRAQKIVTGILGHCPDLVVGRFGPGATFGDRGQYVTIPDKMSSEPTFTSGAWPFLIPWSGTLWASACASSEKGPKRVRGNRFSTVPKDSRKHRGIAIEPSINLYYQLAYGKVIRSRLRSIGLDLSKGQDIHRRLARVASCEGYLATLDLSNASDTICRNLVKFLLPSKWFEVLSDLRSPMTNFKGNWFLLEKFSSMGNGFTFELETVIFLSLVAAICGREKIGTEIFAFGDDLIFPASSSKDVISLLSYCGFAVNMRKTYIDGPFRESCGGDYFDGVAVRPHFLRQSPNEPQQLIALANGLRRSSCEDFVRWSFCYRAWRTVLEGLPLEIRSLRGPSDLGDIVIHDERDRWRTRWRNGVRYIRVYRPARYRKISWEGFSPSVVLAAAVYGVPWNHGNIIPRDSVVGYKTGWVAYS